MTSTESNRFTALGQTDGARSLVEMGLRTMGSRRGFCRLFAARPKESAMTDSGGHRSDVGGWSLQGIILSAYAQGLGSGVTRR
jgi:hypothetical protein